MTSLTVLWKRTCSLFFIKEPDHLSTLKRNLFLAGDVRLHEASLKKTLELLRELPKCEVSLWDRPFLPETFVYKQKLDFHETRNMQFKDYSSSSKTTVKKIIDEKCDIQKQSSAFAKLSGGIILVGVSNDGKYRLWRKQFKKGWATIGVSHWRNEMVLYSSEIKSLEC